MADRSDITHPFRDIEVLEQYALDRLSSSERSAIDLHCRGCEECRQLLGEELRLAAGVRRTARKQMQVRLAERISASRGREIPWPRVIAAAAMALIVAGVGVIGFWLREGKDEVSLPSETAVPPYAAEHEQARPPLIPPAEKRESIPDHAAASRQKAPGVERRELAEAKGAEETGKAQNRRDSPGAMKRPERETMADAATAAAPQIVSGEGYWTEGIVSEGPAAADAVQSYGIEDIRPPAPEAQVRAARKATGTSVAPNQQVTLSQQPSRFLPARGQQTQIQATGKGVPTLVRQVDGQLSLTLYPDSLFPPQALQQATVRRSGNDSLLVQVGSRLIRYRLPSSLLQQVPVR